MNNEWATSNNTLRFLINAISEGPFWASYERGMTTTQKLHMAHDPVGTTAKRDSHAESATFLHAFSCCVADLWKFDHCMIDHAWPSSQPGLTGLRVAALSTRWCRPRVSGGSNSSGLDQDTSGTVQEPLHLPVPKHQGGRN